MLPIHKFDMLLHKKSGTRLYTSTEKLNTFNVGLSGG